MVNSIQSPDDFNLELVTISSERFATINITNITAEINIFEHINTPYLTGSITILDDKNVFNALNIQGTERIRVELSAPNSGKIEKDFVVLNAGSIEKLNDQTTIITLNLRENAGYYNDIIKFSKFYDGVGERIIEKILFDKLKKNLSTRSKFQTSQQKLFRYIVPYITPFDAVNHILDKITTEDGMPYFLSASLLSDDLFLNDLGSILSQQPFNASFPFVYSQSASQDPATQFHAIKKIKGDVVEDTLMTSQLGAIGSRYSVSEIHNGNYADYHYSIETAFQQLVSKNILPSGADGQNDYFLDDKFLPETLLQATNQANGGIVPRLYDYDSRHFYEIAGSTYATEVGTGQIIHNYTQEDNIADYFLRIISYALKNYLLKNTYTITVPGIMFSDPNNLSTSVGNQIRVQVFKSDMSITGVDTVDNKLSGDFVMLAKRHVFDCGSFSHTVQIHCGRVAKQRGE